MELPGIPIGGVWSFIKWLPNFILKRLFPKESLARLIYVDLKPRHDPATINFGECASYDIWLNLINLSPFEVELDRGAFKFFFGAQGIESSILRKQVIQSGEIALVHISAVISDGQANQGVRAYASDPTMKGWLEGHIEFNCSLHSFSRSITNLDGIQPRVINARFRLSS